MRRKPVPVSGDYIKVPQEILDIHQDVTVAADFMFVNGISFFVSVSRHIHFTTVEGTPSRSKNIILQCIRNITSQYNKRGFGVTNFLFDQEGDNLKDNFASMGITLNPAAAREHVPEKKRQIRTLKERIRAGLH